MDNFFHPLYIYFILFLCINKVYLFVDFYKISKITFFSNSKLSSFYVIPFKNSQKWYFDCSKVWHELYLAFLLGLPSNYILDFISEVKAFPKRMTSVRHFSIEKPDHSTWQIPLIFAFLDFYEFWCYIFFDSCYSCLWKSLLDSQMFIRIWDFVNTRLDQNV